MIEVGDEKLIFKMGQAIQHAQAIRPTGNANHDEVCTVK